MYTLATQTPKFVILQDENLRAVEIMTMKLADAVDVATIGVPANSDWALMLETGEGKDGSSTTLLTIVNLLAEFEPWVLAENKSASPDSLGRDAGEARSAGHASTQPNKTNYNDKCNVGGNK